MILLRIVVCSVLLQTLAKAAFSLGLFFLVLHQGGWQWGQDLAENALSLLKTVSSEPSSSTTVFMMRSANMRERDDLALLR